MNQWPNPFIEQRAVRLSYVTVATTISLLQYLNMTGWRYAGPTLWKGCALPPRLSSGASQKAAP